MKLPIKFRAIHAESGEYVYGDVVHVNIKPRGLKGGEDFWIVTKVKHFEDKQGYWNTETEYAEIEEGTLQQLIGYDNNGNEIYKDC